MASSLYSALMDKSTSHGRAVFLSESKWSELFSLIERWHADGGDQPPDDVDNMPWLVNELLENACDYLCTTKRVLRGKPRGGVRSTFEPFNLLMQRGAEWEIQLIDTRDRMLKLGAKGGQARLLKATLGVERLQWRKSITCAVWMAVEQALKPFLKIQQDRMSAYNLEQCAPDVIDQPMKAKLQPKRRTRARSDFSVAVLFDDKRISDLETFALLKQLEATTPARRELFPTLLLADDYRADRLTREQLRRFEHLAITRSGVLLSELLDAIDLARQTDPTLAANDLRRSVARRPMLQDEFGRICARLKIPLASPPAKSLGRLKFFLSAAIKIFYFEDSQVSEAFSERRLHVKGTSK